ncbi:beta-amylase 3, chloroplastic [Pelomyxa schiedti]|nr:beta-amylase 3, chloroplastic [Pelomyxa schiedti]
MGRWAIYAAGVLCLVAIVGSIPVNVMLPLDMIDANGLTNPTQLQSDLNKLKAGGVNGVMSDIWWGLVETSSKSYNWTGYQQLASMIKSTGLKWQAVMSFHKCGGNVGDSCNIPLPSWILSVGNSNKDIWYRDEQYGYDEEYISLGVDDQALFSGRTPLSIYKDFMNEFKTTFASYISSSTLTEIQVGLGPCGETRYPSYQLQDNKWTYCGIGEFQCYDKYMLADLQAAATAAGHSEWGKGGPSNAGTYNSYPSDTGFFTSSGTDNYSTDYGKFFLDWYTETLISHGESVLSSAKSVFGTSVELAAKVSGIHWWYSDNSHAAELTAGYYNTNQNDAYYIIASMFAKYGIAFDFTCLEMTDSSSCGSRPEELVKQTRYAAINTGINYDGENALDICNPTCYQSGFDEIYKEATQYGNIHAFTYLRLTRNLVDNSANWNMFTSFVSKMKSAG